MAGWGKKKADLVKAAFHEHLNNTWVKSKENGWIILGKNLYDAQLRVINAIFTGLSEGKHDFKILKSRQLGVSTITRALMLFWSGTFELTGALVFHTTEALDEARSELIDMLERMDDQYGFPRKKSSNRYALSLENRSRINLRSAGLKETKGSKALGAGSAVSLTHRSELCSYGDAAGLEAMRHSMARTNPNRLFVDESTARGKNLWFDIWSKAKNDPDCVCIFVGWWSKPDQRIANTSLSFEKYTKQPLTDDEKRKIQEVRNLYGHEITIEQLAWIRKEMDPGDDDEDPDKSDFSGDPLRLQEQPWVESDAWQMTGAVFFDPKVLTEHSNKWCNNKYTGYMFQAGLEFVDLRAMKAPNARSVQLKVWEEPVDESVYVISTDPAYGINENNDRSAIQVMRAYSDGLDQVAEYAWPMIDSQQLAWVIAALEAWYAGEKSEVYRIIEINGPGEATFRELQSLKQKIQYQYFGNQLAERGLTNIQQNVRNYFYHRSDAMRPGQSYQFKTQSQLKVAIMERLRDHTNSGVLRVRSQETINEMVDITREGDSIAAVGNDHDDRVFSLAMAIRHWEEVPRRRLMATKRTRERELAKRRMSVIDMAKAFNENQFGQYLAGQDVRRRMLAQAQQGGRWGRR